MTNLLFVPNPLLRQKAEKIRSVGPDEKKIANKMMDVMLRAPGVGLAANQIGILKQIVTIFFVEKESKREIISLKFKVRSRKNCNFKISNIWTSRLKTLNRKFKN